MPFLQEVSLEVIICAYFINGMFLVFAVGLSLPIYTPFDVSHTINGVPLPHQLQQNATNNILGNMTSNINNQNTTNSGILGSLFGIPLAFFQWVWVFVTFITGTFFFNISGNYLTGPTAQAFGYIIGGFVIFCLGRTILFYTRGV